MIFHVIHITPTCNPTAEGVQGFRFGSVPVFGLQTQILKPKKHCSWEAWECLSIQIEHVVQPSVATQQPMSQAVSGFKGSRILFPVLGFVRNRRTTPRFWPCWVFPEHDRPSMTEPNKQHQWIRGIIQLVGQFQLVRQTERNVRIWPSSLALTRPCEILQDLTRYIP